MRFGIRCLVTAGPTREFFDPVRFVSNPSSGKMGYALAAEAVAAGWAVDLVSGPVAIPAPTGVIFHGVTTGAEMFARVDSLFGACDILIMTAAVCDFRPKSRFSEKVKKDSLARTVEFEPVADILHAMGLRRKASQTLVGFAAETREIEAYAAKKLLEKNLDLIVANRVGGPRETNAFEADDNTVTLLGKSGSRVVYGPAPKQKIAAALIAEIAAHHAQKSRA